MMIRQHIKIVFRYFKSNLRYSILNTIGLTLGLTLSIMMILLLQYELSFDTFHSKRDIILKVGTQDLKSGEFESHTPMPLSLTLKNDFPEVKHVVGVWQIIREDDQLTISNTDYMGFNGASVEPDFFSIFDYKLIQGARDNLLNNPDEIYISESLARKVFGKEDPVSKIITLRQFSFTIAGVFADVPKNSEVSFDVLFSDKIREVVWADFPIAWWSGGMHTYVILEDGVPVDQFNAHLKEIPEIYYPDFLKGRSTFFTAPFKGLHFNRSIKGGLVATVSPLYLILLGSIAFVTLLIACINFINLSACQTAKRGYNMAIRKMSGAKSKHLIMLQMGQSFLTVFIASLLSLIISYLLLPYFENLVQRPISSLFFSFRMLGTLLLLVFLIAVITGYFPGIFSSKNSIIKNLQFRLNPGNSNSAIRNGFITFQFVITVLLIVCQLFVLKQVYYMRNADLGFDNENLLAIDVGYLEAPDQQKKYEMVEGYKHSLASFGSQYGFSKGAITENVPGYYYQNSFTLLPVDGKIDECLVISTAIDEAFLDVYEVEMVEGRFFNKEHASDKWAFVINETLMKQIGWESIEGKYMRYQQDAENTPVIGVMKDIHTTSLKEPIGPMVFKFGQHNNSPGFLTFRLHTSAEVSETITFLENKWKEMFPETPFNHFFVKDQYFKNYSDETRLSKIIGSFVLLAIFLSALGLFGLVVFFAEQRTKEIGIRKVNGAKTKQILTLLNQDFIKWVVVAFVIACPIAWYAMSRWLENFAYKTQLSWWVFALAGLIALVIALVTVSWQSWRAASRNPVESLRYE